MSGHIEHESQNISNLGEQMAEALGQQTAPGAYLSGQRLIGTDAEDGKLTLHFDGGWYLVVTGKFNVTLAENAEDERQVPYRDAGGNRIFGNKAINLMTGEEIEGEVVAEEG